MMNRISDSDAEGEDVLLFSWLSSHRRMKTDSFEEQPLYEFEIDPDRNFELENSIKITNTFIDNMFINRNLEVIEGRIIVELY